ncbi:hypothetical protein COY32_00990 [candidate division WWE3 bacterium CG_4_10_14_0_2_um_filter_41_14]|uniref:Uncharacterized protein n=1 Tax=candidate division WWE3 bacterium CG_4_10_14_0_2_um_filter_41_14 TaxID=1975072 RepID=A0A2M7TLH0_UNCKA|nr:MAG: hypothetical protein COY32_00990 [candidate division WWE3 bacterium CG_4_10_14_0_2_um_filter_41_14]
MFEWLKKLFAVSETSTTDSVEEEPTTVADQDFSAPVVETPVEEVNTSVDNEPEIVETEASDIE